MLFASIKLIHLLSLLLLASSSIAKNLLVRKTLSPESIRKCRAADRVSGAMAGLMVVSGIGMLYLSPKGYSFYGSNALFWLKIAILVVASLFIIRTKIFFKSFPDSQQSGGFKAPGSIRSILAFDLFSLSAMAVLGVLIVKGTKVNF
jgi:uncharacterized membrane protein